jgi:hypothetical protein
MRSKRLSLLVFALLFAGNVAYAKENDLPPFAWPAAATQDEVAEGKKLTTRSGLVLLKRHCVMQIRSYGVSPSGVFKDEFLRFLVADEKGVHNCKLELNDDSKFVAEVVEGRTILPDGKVVPVDSEKDILRTEIQKGTEKNANVALATVNFPASQIGAVLELHAVLKWKTENYHGWYFDIPQAPTQYSELLVLKDSPSLETSLDVELMGGLGGEPWSVCVLGAPAGTVSLTSSGKGLITVKMGRYIPLRQEVDSPPARRIFPIFLCYLNENKFHSSEQKQFQSALGIDSRGCVTGITFPPEADTTKYWHEYLEQDRKNNDAFMHMTGAVGDIVLEAVAPATMSLDDRVKALYEYTQAHVRYTPDANDVTSVGAVARRGMRSPWQGTLYFAALLKRANIPFDLGLVAARYNIRFAPSLTNSDLFGFSTVVRVALPNGQAGFFMPGHLGVGYGDLPEIYQDSIALFLAKDDSVEWAQSPSAKLSVEPTSYLCKGALDTNGGFTGTLNVTKGGAPGKYFLWHYLAYQYSEAHPPHDKRDRPDPVKVRQDLEKRLKEEMELPGSHWALAEPAVSTWPADPSHPYTLQAKLTGNGLAQQAGAQWMVYAFPLYSGFSNPYTEAVRFLPVWSDKAGHFTVEGEVSLPAGYKVSELPKPTNVVGPYGCQIASSIESTEKDGVATLHSLISFDIPQIVGKDDYSAFRSYMTSLAQVMQQRCIITPTAGAANKDLE